DGVGKRDGALLRVVRARRRGVGPLRRGGTACAPSGLAAVVRAADFGLLQGDGGVYADGRQRQAATAPRDEDLSLKNSLRLVQWRTSPEPQRRGGLFVPGAFRSERKAAEKYFFFFRDPVSFMNVFG